ncbi:hypothetical protein ACS0TY_004900 [Phlomoides rotata]
METAIAPQSRKIELHDGDETPSLVEEIIFEEILPKLPVKSLLKFRCVAKSWCSLIGSKRFIKAHLNNSIKSSTSSHHRIFFKALGGFKQCSLPSFDKPLTTYSITYNADFGIYFKYKSLCLVGCCDGLVCFLINKRRYVLWNPATKKTYFLPDVVESIVLHGFGFDESNHDYKVFYTNVASGCSCKVYSLKTNSWKAIELRFYFAGSEYAGTHVCGKLHWCVYDMWMIVTFDLNSHVEGVVGLPRCTEGMFCQRLGVLRGCLSAHMFHPNGDLDVWLMKEYGVTDSWEKVATVSFCNDLRNDSIPIPLAIGPNDLRNDSIPIPLAIGPNGEILLIYQSNFLIYNPKCDVYQRAQITGRYLQFHDMGMYIESLVSVAPDAEEES